MQENPVHQICPPRSLKPLAMSHENQNQTRDFERLSSLSLVDRIQHLEEQQR